jgi:hypothetical protein
MDFPDVVMEEAGDFAVLPMGALKQQKNTAPEGAVSSCPELYDENQALL